MSTPSKSKQEIVTEFRTTEILDAARKVFVQKGFRDATVDDIAEAANVSKGTVYLYFASKQDIYIATIDREVGKHLNRLNNALRPEMTPQEVLFTIATSFMEHWEQNRDFLLVCVAEFGRFTTDESLPQPICNARRQHTEIIQRALEEGIRTGIVRELPVARTAAAILLFVKSWAMRRLTDGTDVPTAEDAALVSELIWKGISQ